MSSKQSPVDKPGAPRGDVRAEQRTEQRPVQKDLKHLSRAFKALSNPHRLQLFLNLLEESRLDLAKGRVHDCFLTKILGNLTIGAPTVSHHVKELADAGLITTEREGKQLICSVNPEAVEALRGVFALPG